jgi:hypothetical protein
VGFCTTPQAGTPKPLAKAAQSITGRTRSVSASALGSGLRDNGAGKLGLQDAVAAARAHHDCHLRALAGHRP